MRRPQAPSLPEAGSRNGNRVPCGAMRARRTEIAFHAGLHAQSLPKAGARNGNRVPCGATRPISAKSRRAERESGSVRRDEGARNGNRVPCGAIMARGTGIGFRAAPPGPISARSRLTERESGSVRRDNGARNGNRAPCGAPRPNLCPKPAHGTGIGFHAAPPGPIPARSRLTERESGSVRRPQAPSLPEAGSWNGNRVPCGAMRAHGTRIAFRVG